MEKGQTSDKADNFLIRTREKEFYSHIFFQKALDSAEIRLESTEINYCTKLLEQYMAAYNFCQNEIYVTLFCIVGYI